MKIGFRLRKRLLIYLAVLGAMIGFLFWCTTMPGRSFEGTPAPLDEHGLALERQLRAHVEQLAGSIGPRHLDGRTEGLLAAANYLRGELERYGYTVRAIPVEVNGERADNLEAIRAGTDAESFVVGAHYDSVALDDPSADCPAADDNASGVAVALALAERFATTTPKRTVRFAFFVNEEPPYFWRETMGSVHYANDLQKSAVPIRGMWSLETLGYYRDEEDTQHYPPIARPLYPNRGNFLAFVGNVRSHRLVRRSVERFRAHAEVPSEGAAMPELVQGVGWSDQWAFWKIGAPALMITDTAPFRNPNYHTPRDSPDTLDYTIMARATRALGDTLLELVDE